MKNRLIALLLLVIPTILSAQTIGVGSLDDNGNVENGFAYEASIENISSESEKGRSKLLDPWKEALNEIFLLTNDADIKAAIDEITKAQAKNIQPNDVFILCVGEKLGHKFPDDKYGSIILLPLYKEEKVAKDENYVVIQKTVILPSYNSQKGSWWMKGLYVFLQIQKVKIINLLGESAIKESWDESYAIPKISELNKKILSGIIQTPEFEEYVQVSNLEKLKDEERQRKVIAYLSNNLHLEEDGKLLQAFADAIIVSLF